jgi:hypothetical protein
MRTSEKILMFVMLIVIALLVWTKKCPQVQSDNGAINSALVSAQATINSQATEMASLRSQLAACQSSTMITSAPAPVVYAPVPTQKRVIQKRTPQVITITPEQISLDEEVSNKSDASTLAVDDSQIYTLPPSFYESGVKGVKLCLRFGGKDNRYWPHIGIIDGSIKIDQNIEGNGEKGYNFLLPGAVSTMKGDIGITRDLTFFVSANIIDKYMLPSDNGLVEIKAPGTSWVAQPLTRFGDYYIFRVVR